MRFFRRVTRILTCSGMALLGSMAMARADWPARILYQFGNHTIEASAGDVAYVEALAVKLADYKMPVEQPQALPGLTLQDLRTKRTEFLARLATPLGKTEASAKMAAAYNAQLQRYAEALDWSPRELPGRLALWRKNELVDRLRAGERIDGVSLDSSGNLRAVFNFSAEGRGRDAAVKATEAWNRQTLVLTLNPEAGLQPQAEIATGLGLVVRTLTREARAQLVTLEPPMVFSVLQSAARAGFAWEASGPQDMRWLVEGLATYVALKSVEAAIGREQLGRYYDLHARLADQAAGPGQVNLLAWPEEAAADQPSTASSSHGRLQAYATKVIADICARHGDAFPARWLNEAARVAPHQKLTLDGISRTFRKLTREDLRSYLANPPARRP